MNKKYLIILISIFIISLINAASINLGWIYPTTNINISQNQFFNITANITCTNENCGEINVSLDPIGLIYNFTTCGATGRIGPNQSQCDENYTGTTLNGLVTISRNGTQNWTVPSTGDYLIEVAGAQGGSETGYDLNTGGLGAKMKGTFSLTKGQVIQIVVGQKGTSNPQAPSGGGGSFVVNEDNTPLIIAGGGGGTGYYVNASGTGGINSTNANAGHNPGRAGTTTGQAPGGSNGNGGYAGRLTPGGGGFYTDGNYSGADSGTSIAGAGLSFFNGSLGGTSATSQACSSPWTSAPGGFGGGAGASYAAAGPGGGYSGGGGTDGCSPGSGGGGGSYNSGTNQTNLSALNIGDGYVTITALSAAKGGLVSTTIGTTPFYTNTTNPYNLTLNQDESQLITWWVNATGSIDIAHEFFIYANQTSNQSNSNITSILNITINDFTFPAVNITYPSNITYATAITTLNYTYSDTNEGYCWYSTDLGITNSTPVSAGTNFTGLTSSGGSNTWTIYCNDSSNNLNTTITTFTSDIPSINLTWIYPTENLNISQNKFFNITANITCTINDCGEINITLDPEEITQYNFTTCGATGKTGPNQTQCDTNYTGTTLEGLVTINTQGYQEFIVPTTGVYNISAYGASGGIQPQNTPISSGAFISGNVSLTAGTKLIIVVGQRGASSSISDNEAGAGGGTFVTYGNDYTLALPLIVAGGGSGAGSDSNGGDAYTSINGIGSGCTFGGACSNQNDGAGFYFNNSVAAGAKSFRNGATGGTSLSGSPNFGNGGFGGGGGGTDEDGSGGGGFTGGIGTDSVVVTRGGSSFINETLVTLIQNTTSMYGEDGLVSITFSGSSKGGTVSMDSTTTPFYTNTTNPYNLTLNQDESQLITWWVNATGSIDIAHEFFIYANQTSNQSNSNITSILNITINDFTFPAVNITYPSNITYATAITTLNYTYSDTNEGYCWYSTDLGITNSTPVSAGTNFTELNSGGGSHTWTIYCNDSSGNENSSLITFHSAIPIINLTFLSPTKNTNVTKNNFFEIQTRISCSNNDCGEINVTLDPAEGTTVELFTDKSESSWTDNYPVYDTWYMDSRVQTIYLASELEAAGIVGPTIITGIDLHCSETPGRDIANFRIRMQNTDATSLSAFTTTGWTTVYGPETYTKPTVGEWHNHTLDTPFEWDGVSNLMIDFYRNDASYSSNGGNYKRYLGSGDLRTYTGFCDNCASCGTGQDCDTPSSRKSYDYALSTRITYLPSSKGIISTINGTTPFYTNVTNPYNLTLNNGESETISWWVNATGNINDTYGFFIYANQTSGLNLSDITNTWNITILSNGSYVSGTDQAPPAIIFALPNNTYTPDTELDINYRIVEENISICWYSNDTYSTNTTITCGQNLTSLNWTEGQHTLTIWANDSAGNNGSSSFTFTIDTINPNATLLTPENNNLNNSASQNLTVNLTDEKGIKNATLFIYDTSNNLVNQTTTTFAENILKYTLGIVVTLTDGAYNWFYQIFDWAGNTFTTTNNTITIDTSANINFISPTHLNNTYTTNTSIQINTTITEPRLKELTYNWNQTNFTIYNDSLVLMLNFDNISALGENSTHVVDVSREGNNGSIFGDGIINSTGGKYNGALQLDGSDPDDYASIPNNPSLNPQYISVCSWAKFNSISDRPHVVGKGTGGSGAYWMVIESSGELRFYYTQSSSWEYLEGTSGEISIENWYYLCATYNGTLFKSYIDGKEVHSKNDPGTLSTSNSNDVWIGLNSGGSDSFNGSIDEVRIWNRSLSSEEIYQQYISNLNKFNTTQWYFYINQSKNATSNLENGTYTYFSSISDELGNSNLTETRIFTIDTINPNATLLTPENNTFNNSASQNLTVNLTDEKGIKNATLSIYNSSNNLVNQTTITFTENILKYTLGIVVVLTDGVYDWFYQIFDWAGNTFTTQNNTITIDATSPSIKIIYPTNNTFTTNTQINVNYTASDKNLDKCWYSNDTYSTNTTITCGENITSVIWTEGQHNITIWTNDTFENLNSSNLVLTIDTLPPLINITSPLNDSTTADTGIDIKYFISDTNLDKCWYSNDSYSKNTTITCGTNITDITWTEGQHNITIWTNDSANQVNSSSITFTIESTPPILNFINPTPLTNNETENTFVEINISIIESNLDEVIYNWNKTNFTIYNNNLVLMMNFDNLSSLGENSTHIVDISDYSNNGTMGGTAKINSTSKFGNALWLDGNSDYVEVRDSSSLDIGNNSMAITAWVYPRTFTDADEIVKKDLSYILRLSGTSGAIEGYIWANTDINKVGPSTNLLTLNAWNYVALTYNSTHQQLFVNGIADATTPQTGNIDNSAINLMIGSHQNKADEFFDGGIDEVRIWNRALSATEVYQQYASNLNKFNSSHWYFYINQSKNATTGLVDGNYTYFSYVKDDYGNSNVTETRNITIDSVDVTAPIVNITSFINNSYSSDTGLDIEYKVIEPNLDCCWYSNDSMALNTSLGNNGSCKNITSLVWNEGLHNLTIWANDTGGYENSSLIFFTIDNSNPDATLLSPENNSYNATSQNFSANLTDNLGIKNATLFIYNSSNNLVNKTTTTFGGNILKYTLGIVVVLADGVYDWFYEVFDLAENTFTTQNNTITIDTTNPLINITSPTNNTNSSDNNLNINYIISDNNLDSCWYSNDSYSVNTTLDNCANITSVIWSEGMHNIIIWANDSANNINSSSISFTIDTLYPLISYSDRSEENNSNLTKDNIYVNVSVVEINEINISFNLYYSDDSLVNSTTYVDKSRTINWTNLPDNNYKFNVSIYDSVGNFNSTLTRNVAIDTIAPLVIIDSPINQTYAVSSIDFNISVNENLDSCIVSVDDWISNQSMNLNSSLNGANYTNNSMADGSFVAKFWCNDTFGNINNSESISFSIDTINPVVNINFPKDNHYLNYNQSVSLNYSITNNDSDSCWYSLDGEANQSIIGCANLTLNLSEGNHLIELWLNDSANLLGRDSVNFTIDLTAPIINLINPQNNTLNNSANWIDFYYNVSDINNISNCSLLINNNVNLSVMNPEKNQTNNFTVYLLNKNYNWSVNCSDVANNVNLSEIRFIELNYSVIIDVNDFNGETTNFSERINASDLTNLTNLTIEKIEYGKIRFLENLDLSSDVKDLVINFSKHVNISQNKIEINSTELTGLNKRATLQLYNLTFSNPQILKNGAVCASPTCTKESYINQTLTFNVTGFSTYSARETPVTPSTTPATDSAVGGSGGGFRIKPECEKNKDCKEGYSCYENKCVKLFDVEIITINSLIEHLNFELKYLVKGMANINGDVIIKFWIEQDNKKIELGQDTIYLGSFEKQIKTTTLNLPYKIEDGDYNLYIESGYENYKAQSFRKINIKIPEETRIKEKLPTSKTKINFYPWILIILLGLIILALLKRNTRVIILSWLVYIKEKIKNPFIQTPFEDIVQMENKGEEELEKREKRMIQESIPKERMILSNPNIQSFPIPSVNQPNKNKINSFNYSTTNEIPLRSLSQRKVYTESGNLIGKIERATILDGKISGWIIKPNKEYNLQKEILIKHENVKEIKPIFIVDKKINEILNKIKYEKNTDYKIKENNNQHNEQYNSPINNNTTIHKSTNPLKSDIEISTDFLKNRLREKIKNNFQNENNNLNNFKNNPQNNFKNNFNENNKDIKNKLSDFQNNMHISIKKDPLLKKLRKFFSKKDRF